ncbi:hypothetical protein [Labrenzia sp. R5_0]|uniref:hypothetical protein n=1 Tax=Labrenzia sp. R5_0 TaxID=2821108 RepID=UPI0025704056|nr:hypothetical protein [Labrenzia sp. R5_0]
MLGNIHHGDQIPNLSMVPFCHLGMKERWSLFEILQQGFQFQTPCFKRMHLVFDGCNWCAIRNCVNHLGKLPFDFLQFLMVMIHRSIVRLAQLIHMPGVFFAK